jgi:type IV secretory pathway VirB2 component (pilin)
VAPDPLGQCAPVFNFPNDVLAVALALIDILLRVAGFVAVISIIIVGFQHIFTGGNPENAANARKRLLYAILGLLIAMLATVVVTFIGNQLT